MRLRWNAGVEGITIEFEIDGVFHTSTLPWTELDKMRLDLLNKLASMVPKEKAAPATDPSSGLPLVRPPK